MPTVLDAPGQGPRKKAQRGPGSAGGFIHLGWSVIHPGWVALMQVGVTSAWLVNQAGEERSRSGSRQNTGPVGNGSLQIGSPEGSVKH